MSTIRAKQQICLNIHSIHCYSSYSTGRYCLRFSFHETHPNPPTQPQPHNFAIPVTIIQSNPSPCPTFQQSQIHYYTKPFLLKPNSQIAINQICIFKHDINIFNSKYQTDYHQIVMKCVCQLIGFDYSGGQGKVIGVFEGKLRGVGVGDALVVDFSQGVSCQVLGTVHNCVYQFQYVWLGGRKDGGVMKDSLHMQNNQLMVVNPRRPQPHKQTSINFQKYCQLQSKQYVQSLLQYLLSQVKKSDQKILRSLQIFKSILPQLQQQPLPSVLRSQIAQQCPQQQYISQLQKSIRNKSQLQAQQYIDEDMKERLSVLRSQSIYYEPGEEEYGEIILEEEQNQPHYQHTIKNNGHGNNGNNGNGNEIWVKSNKLVKRESDQQQIIIILDSDEQKIEQYDPNKNKTRNLTTKQQPLQLNFDIHKDLPTKQSPVRTSKNRIFDNKSSVLQANQRFLYNQGHQAQRQYHQGQYSKISHEDEQARNKRRRKIFVHTQNNINVNSNVGIEHSSKLNYYANIQHETPQFDAQASLYEARYIPNKPINTHPNKTSQNKPQQKQKQKLTQKSSSISKVTIQEFEKLLHNNCLNIYEKWRKFINHLTQPQGNMLVAAYKAQYRKKLESLLGESIVRFKGSFDVDVYSKEQSQRNKMAYQIRSQTVENEQNMQINQFRFYPTQLFSSSKPILFQQKFQKSSYTPSIPPPASSAPKKNFLSVSLSNTNAQKQIKHLLILVHGLGACRLDMQKLKVQMKRNFKQKVHVYISCANQGRTEGDIGLMGVRLGHQVQQEIGRNGGIQGGVRVSFVGHSMGGIIIRSALPRLQKYKHMFHSFVSLSSPHIGYCISSSKLIDVGLWLINNWKKCESILQLTMSDFPSSQTKHNFQQTFLYKLSLQKGLQWFKKITFMASRQDLYVPYFSARIQKPDQLQTDIKSTNQYTLLHSKMVDNILGRITGSVTRIDVNFCITEQNIDNLIGRAAHICFVGNCQFLRLITVVDQAVFV